jgi:hypothetical protein
MGARLVPACVAVLASRGLMAESASAETISVTRRRGLTGSIGPCTAILAGLAVAFALLLAPRALAAPAVHYHIEVTAPKTTPAKSSFNVTVTARSASGEIEKRSPMLKITSNDPNATIPAAVQMLHGTATFSATLRTAGERVITVTPVEMPRVAPGSATVTVEGPQAANINTEIINKTNVELIDPRHPEEGKIARYPHTYPFEPLTQAFIPTGDPTRLVSVGTALDTFTTPGGGTEVGQVGETQLESPECNPGNLSCPKILWNLRATDQNPYRDPSAVQFWPVCEGREGETEPACAVVFTPEFAGPPMFKYSHLVKIPYTISDGINESTATITVTLWQEPPEAPPPPTIVTAQTPLVTSSGITQGITQDGTVLPFNEPLTITQVTATGAGTATITAVGLYASTNPGPSPCVFGTSCNATITLNVSGLQPTSPILSSGWSPTTNPQQLTIQQTSAPPLKVTGLGTALQDQFLSVVIEPPVRVVKVEPPPVPQTAALFNVQGSGTYEVKCETTTVPHEIVGCAKYEKAVPKICVVVYNEKTEETEGEKSSICEHFEEELKEDFFATKFEGCKESKGVQSPTEEQEPIPGTEEVEGSIVIKWWYKHETCP